jgi:hypothetical protein
MDDIRDEKTSELYFNALSWLQKVNRVRSAAESELSRQREAYAKMLSKKQQRPYQDVMNEIIEAEKVEG